MLQNFTSTRASHCHDGMANSNDPVGYREGNDSGYCDYGGFVHKRTDSAFNSIAYGFTGGESILFFTVIWFIFTIIFLGCLVRYRTKIEYGLLALLSLGTFLDRFNLAVQFVAFLLGTLCHADIMVNMYLASIMVMNWIVYFFYDKW